MANVSKLPDVNAELSAEQAAAEMAKVHAAETDKRLAPYIKSAQALGVETALGKSALTRLCFKYQAGLIAGELQPIDNVRLYNAYADAHDATVKSKELENTGITVIEDSSPSDQNAMAVEKPTIKESSRSAARSNLYTFSDPYVLAMGPALYKLILETRNGIEAKERIDASPLSCFVLVNRRIAEKGLENAATVKPEDFTFTRDEIEALLRRNKTVKSDSDILADLIAALAKANKRPALSGKLAKAMELMAEIKVDFDADIVQAKRDAEQKAQAEEIRAQVQLRMDAARAANEKVAA